MDKLEVICFVLVVLSAIPFVMLLIKRSMQKKFMDKAVTTTALITHCEKRFGLKGAVYYVLSLQYLTKDGQQIQTNSIVSKKRAAGDILPLMYLPGEPAKFSLDFGTKLPLAMAASIVFFGLMLWFCIWLLHYK